MRLLVGGDLQPAEFAMGWLTARRRALTDGERLGAELDRHLNQVFYALDEYPIDPALREDGDTTDAELLVVVERVLSLLWTQEAQ
ncbi:hypothetical protein ABT084_24365 [Streptomyces sp. NPDC002138]|uniref:hypothetical protein n=1 Tax=Streptomyces sp. NPDC002138 TaxID=3154410 RepID=UPI0033165D62